MLRSTQALYRSGLRCRAMLGVAVLVAQSAFADSPTHSKSTAAAASNIPWNIETPMTGKGPGVAPYSVRLRITGFLSRQHAREGDTRRAIAEFHSMLNVDDPAWPDDEQGDSFRIARDIEVAQMMAESGFCDHAIRVLQTTLILARVNQDPQTAIVERQMLAIAQLAQLKGAAIPPVDISHADAEGVTTELSPVQHAHQESVETTGPALFPATRAKSVEDKLPESTSTEPRRIPDHPASPHKAKRSENVSEGNPQQAGSGNRSRLSNLFSSRRRRAEPDTLPNDAQPPPSSAQSLTSPDVSPTYCPECAAGHRYSSVQTDRVPGSEGLDTREAERRIPKAADAPTETIPSYSRKRELQHQASTSVSKSVSKDRVDQPIEQELRSSPAAEQDPKQDLALTQHEDQLRRAPPRSEPVESPFGSDGPSLRQPLEAKEPPPNEPARYPAEHSLQANARRRIGVAGQVANPGIFSVNGSSTTLAALLRRAGEQSGNLAKQMRIVRTVDLRDLNDAGDSLKDFYCQRLDAARPTGKELDTPIYGQDLVIVEGAGAKPIYVAVMPHFILQIPISTSQRLTGEQVVDLLGAYWPSIREQEIAVIRFDQWTRAAKIAPMQEDSQAADAPLAEGDVLYVDGLELDKSRVLEAAQAIAQLAGARIRAPQTGARQTSAAEE